jgi:tRNA nucleotidyltransferase (CCA-adding enzyme)
MQEWKQRRNQREGIDQEEGASVYRFGSDAGTGLNVDGDIDIFVLLDQNTPLDVINNYTLSK